jgi:hypothetical protein
MGMYITLLHKENDFTDGKSQQLDPNNGVRQRNEHSQRQLRASVPKSVNGQMQQRLRFRL